jgi:predicted short-subunit dehydrogenase-like oxidoreductase (DUF2520 family)
MSKVNRNRQKVVIIGCGNVAWHLAKHLSSLHKYELFVYNHRNNPALKEFQNTFKCHTFSSLHHIIEDGDYYLVTVSDSLISKVEKKINPGKANALIMHTSGSMELSELGDRLHFSAVFYPLQTFSKGDLIDWKEVPVIIEADNEAVRRQVGAFAENFSKKIIFVNYHQRLRIHLAAVLVNNFTNGLYEAAIGLLNHKKNDNYTIDLLKPLIKQTVKKLDKLSPLTAQTGPAKRGDKVAIKKHLDILDKKTDLKRIYKQLTKLIEKQQQKNHA